MIKIGKMLKDKTGVSPIIAIILMVAITVVLAATIYVWVSGMSGGEASKISLNITQTDWDDTSSNTTNTVTYKVYDVAGGPGYEDIKIVINGTVVWDGSTAASGYTLTGIAEGEIEPGDIFVITGPNGNVKVGNTVIIYDLDSGKQIWTATIHY